MLFTAARNAPNGPNKDYANIQTESQHRQISHVMAPLLSAKHAHISHT